MDVVLEDNEPKIKKLAAELGKRMDSPSIQEGSVSEDTLKSLEGLFARDNACSDLPVVGIKFASRGSTAPHDGNEAHCQRNSANSVIYEKNKRPV